MPNRQYLCIDLKSFYASVECADRGLDPMTTNLVVADGTRTDKTICLAVSPSMKALGVRNRCRVFEIPQGIDYIMAPPRMARYIQKSAEIYRTYLRWIGKEDIHVYSIDEAFFDVTPYLGLYGMSARELGERIREDVVATNKIPATCGLGTNLYLAKVALDISAKHRADFFGELDEETYRQTLWNHRPLTDFWRVGPGIAARLHEMGLDTMGQVALANPEPLYQELGKDAEILIDHAWGEEPVGMADIKAYRSKSKMYSSAQVFGCDKNFHEAWVVAKEMLDDLTLRLVDEGVCAGGVSIWVGYALTEEEREEMRRSRSGGRAFRYRGSGSVASARLLVPTSSLSILRQEIEGPWKREIERNRPIHRIGVSLTDIVDRTESGVQLGLFTNEELEDREHTRQEAINAIKRKFGSNALLKGIDLLPGATAHERHGQIGGHRAGEPQ
ncbi:MAG: DNA repair protein [Atopobiaceae bacterium]|jgi:DNA polymerase V